MFAHKLACAVLFFTCVGNAPAGDLVIIVSAKNPVGPLRAEQVADIFLAQSGRFPNGANAVAIDQAIGTSVRDDFYQRVASKSPALVKTYWTKMMFTGRANPPKEAAGNEAVRKLIAGNLELIGYIDRDALDDSVKAVLVLH
ncbi:MAG: phosphate ABC transporter substrate-binding protein [Massilia sp.]|nr:phosphate ABC transporter substrate-binding protein [Massilia sp.]